MTASQLRLNVGALLIFFGLVGIGILAAGVRICFLAGASRSWPRVTARIVSIQETSSSSSHGRSSTRTDVLYDYAAGDQLYQSSRKSFGFMGKSFQQQLQKMRSGDSVSVSVDSRDPSRAVLFPGITFDTCVPVFVGIGTLGFTIVFGIMVHRDPPWKVGSDD